MLPSLRSLRNFAAAVLAVAATAATSQHAHAKKVSIRWKALRGAAQYEILVQKDGKRVSTQKLEEPAWSGDLPFGIYSYQIRGVDRHERPGQWTPQLPLAVMPAEPEASGPDNGKKLTYYDPKAGPTLEWKRIDGVDQYRVEVLKGGKPVSDQVVSNPQLGLKSLPPGDYSWRVTAIVKPKGRVPASFAAKQWRGKPSELSSFHIERAKLARPSPSYPVGVMLPPSDGRTRFKWSKVDGAEAYRLEVYPKETKARAPASGPLKPLARVTVKDNVAEVPLSADGQYTWKVRALASVPTPAELAAGATETAGDQSATDFKIDKNAAFLEGSGYIALSTMFAPYSYVIVSPANNIKRGAADSSAITWRGSAEYWLKPQWGLSTAFEFTTFQIQSQSFSRKGYELLGKYRMNFGGGKYNWSLSPKFGVEGREYFQVVPASAAIQTFGLTTYGAAVGIDVRKAFSDRFSVGVKFSYFKPLLVSAGEVDALTSSASNRNFSIGAQVLYWIGKRWGLGAGALVESRSISYSLKSAPNGKLTGEEIYMDGKYFFGSLIYSFGR